MLLGCDLGEAKPMVNTIYISVLDDELLVAAGVASLLVNHPEIQVAWTGTSAAQLLAHVKSGEHLDVALIDVALGTANPEAKTVVAALTERGVACILVSSLTSGRRVREAILDGACGYIPKSAAPQDLADAIRQAAAGELILTPEMAAILAERASPHLSERELEVLRLYAKGMKGRTAARRLHISEDTLRTHLSRIRGKYRALGLDVGTKQDLLYAAIADDFLDEAIADTDNDNDNEVPAPDPDDEPESRGQH